MISKELQLFFDKVCAALLDHDHDPEVVTLRESALESLRSDPGLHQLVPYFVQFIAEKVTNALEDTFVLQQMMELTSALVSNKTLFMDPYVAALTPSILTCLIGRHVGPESGDNNTTRQKFQLRDIAASLIGQLSGKFSKSSSELQARLCRTCLKYFLDPTRSIGEHYGALSGITSIGGSAAIASLVIPNLKAYEYVLVKAQNDHPDSISLRMLISAIMRAIETLAPDGSTADAVNGSNGNTDEVRQIEEFIGNVIGNRIVRLGNPALNKAILELREKS